MSDFRRYHAYDRALACCLALYQATATFPQTERFGLVQQLRRSAVSIPANLAEGLGKPGERERVRYVNIALGSASEVDCLLEIAHRLGYLKAAQYADLGIHLVHTRKLLCGLRRKMSDG